jgi:hypothetical protein
MPERVAQRRGLLLLLSLLLVSLMYPVMDYDLAGKLIIALVTFVPLIFATIKLSQKKGWLWPSMLLVSRPLVLAASNFISPNPAFAAATWVTLTAFFVLTVVGLFSYLMAVRVITDAHLYTAASIYLLLGMLSFALYSAIEEIQTGSFTHITHSAAGTIDWPSDLLYFSMAALTLGYGDMLPVSGVVRMLLALEAGSGVLYLAITVVLLVSAHKQRNH